MTEPSFGSADAAAIITAIVTEANRRAVVVTIAVADAAGGLISLHRMDGCARLATITVQRKIASVTLTGASTAETATALTDEPTLAPSMLAAGVFPVPGGVPVRPDGRLVGVVAVSGASSAEDDDLARAGISATVGL
jgi:glc operon protein GlcG